MQEVLSTTEQVANYLKMEKCTVCRLMAQKKLPASRWAIDMERPNFKDARCVCYSDLGYVLGPLRIFETIRLHPNISLPTRRAMGTVRQKRLRVL